MDSIIPRDKIVLRFRHICRNSPYAQCEPHPVDHPLVHPFVPKVELKQISQHVQPGQEKQFPQVLMNKGIFASIPHSLLT